MLYCNVSAISEGERDGTALGRVCGGSRHIGGKRAGAGADRPAAPAGTASRAAARHHRDRDAARRGAQLHPAQPWRNPSTTSAQAPSTPCRRARMRRSIRCCCARRAWCRTVSARSTCAATTATCNTGSTACSCRKACRCSATSCARATPQQLSLITGALPAQYGLQHRRRRRHHAQVGHHQSRRRGLDDGRLAQLAAARLLLWRPQRARSTISPPASTSTMASASRTRRRRYTPIHDDTDQWYGLAKITGIIDEQTRGSASSPAAPARASRSPTIPARRRTSPWPARPT